MCEFVVVFWFVSLTIYRFSFRQSNNRHSWQTENAPNICNANEVPSHDEPQFIQIQRNGHLFFCYCQFGTWIFYGIYTIARGTNTKHLHCEQHSLWLTTEYRSKAREKNNNNIQKLERRKIQPPNSCVWHKCETVAWW